MATSKIKGIDEQTLEGGLGGAGGAGGRSATAKKVESMTPQERAALENPGKQFETLHPIEERALEKVRKAKELKDPPEFANPGKQFETMSPIERRALEKVHGKLKKGGAVSASKRADGIAKRGKTRGRVL